MPQYKRAVRKKITESFQDGYREGASVARVKAYEEGKQAGMRMMSDSFQHQRIDAATKLMSVVGQTIQQLNELIKLCPIQDSTRQDTIKQ